ncbi:MAG: DUF6265 family protein [bacterium]
MGKWICLNGDKIQTETWEEILDNTFRGKGINIDNTTNKIMDYEDLLLVQMDNDIFYIAKVSKNEFPVPFKLTAVSKNQVVFENPNHDFPQKIIYSLLEPNKLKVEVKAGENGFVINFIKEKIK